MGLKVFPVYAVTDSMGRHCGHQHQFEAAANNCAINSAMSNRDTPFKVRKWEVKGILDEDPSSTITAIFECPLVPSDEALETA